MLGLGLGVHDLSARSQDDGPLAPGMIKMLLSLKADIHAKTAAEGLNAMDRR